MFSGFIQEQLNHTLLIKNNKMKKNYALLLLSVAALTANAQQINGDFDAAWEKCVPWDSKGNTMKKGVQPQGWHMANVVLAGEVGEKITRSAKDEPANYAVKVNNIYNSIVKQNIPGYFTLGTPWATAETKGVKVRNSDGGTFGGKEFTYHPDAISFEYQRDNSNGTDEPATVLAYLWNGTWTQKDVPGNNAIGVFSWGSATRVDMQNRERNVLGMSKTATGGDVTKTEGATLVATIDHAITESTEGEWKTDTIPFVYKEGCETAGVENINVIFSSANYFGPQSDIKAGNSLTVDNVKLIYYHALSSLKPTDNYGYDVDINFSPDTYNYTVESTYDPDWTTVGYTKKGVGATVEAAYDDLTGQYVITVKGEDYNAETNPEAKSVYTIQYQKAAPTLTSLNVAGHEFIPMDNTSKDFTATGNCYTDEVSYVASSEKATVEQTYDEAEHKLTLTVSEAGCPSSVYTVTFEGQSKEAAYQIANADFENWTDDENAKIAEGWNSFDTAAGLFASFASMSPMPQKIEGYKGNGVRIVSKDLWVAYANGNITTGHINMGSTDPTDASNYNFTDRTDVNGNMPFAGRPDAFEVYARFAPGTAKAATDEAEEQPALQGRVQLILHKDAAYHDPEIAEMADEKVGSANVLIPATEEWTKFTGEFSYTTDATPEVQYLLASATTNPVPGASKDDQLDLDELRLIYYSTLKDLQIDGKTIEGFSPEKTEYTIESDNADLLNTITFEKKGVGASVDKDVDLTNNVCTITVYGNDYDVNPANKTVYTVKLTPTTSIGSVSADNAANHKTYTLGGVRINKPAAGLYIVDGKKKVVK